MTDNLHIYTYDTLEECIAAFHGCGTAEIYSKGPWTWEENGRITVWGMRRMIRSRRKCGTWGFCRNKKELHLWVSKYAEPKRIIRLLSHELGHMQRPFKRDSLAEERKAESYCNVAVTAFELMTDLLDKKNEQYLGS